MKSVELALEWLIFNSRWLLAPFFLGLVVAVCVLMAQFFDSLAALVLGVFVMPKNESIIAILTLVDFALVAALLVMIILSGYESFVSRIDFGDQKDRPAWMGKVGFADLKLKLLAAIVAISAIELLKTFLEPGPVDDNRLAWKVGIHLTFAVSGVLFALSDWLSENKK
jgi:uncharacterized protein (TIGR00645 family)